MKNKKRKHTPHVYSMRGEKISGFCPICVRSVDIMISEDSVEVFGICLECGSMLFYSHKESSINIEDFFEPKGSAS